MVSTAESGSSVAGFAATGLFFAVVFAAVFAADGKTHHVVLNVDQNDPEVMNQTLNNVSNVIEYYRDKNQDVDIDIVTYGPGLNMLRADTSPVRDRIRRLKDMVFPGKIQFSACNVTKQAMATREGHRQQWDRIEEVHAYKALGAAERLTREGHEIAILPDATIVPSGIVHLMELQEQGWSYVRP